MNFSEAISACMSKYATFDGRSSRSEFWWFNLFTVLLSWGASIVGVLTLNDGGNILSSIVDLVFLLPSLAVSSRRLHDINRSGWWTLIVITVIGLIPLIYWWAKESDPAENQYGAKPAK